MNFWLNLAIVMATGYIVIWYVFEPTDNQCQMTFMMEPPKFIPIPVTESQKAYQNLGPKKRRQLKVEKEYKLFVYSEFGFPEFGSGMRTDFRDSMPVIFVPGNAGSYQQVRSIASTCIRLQLQSLDAYKFIFYTIDFRGQFSGIDGELIEEQISFLHQSLNEVIQMHPSETNGVILIGHSVGGFISKALFSRKSFNPNSVPLLISLASPLTSPYLNFDSKMRDLYSQTQKYWTKNINNIKLNTLSLSINGGRSDHLVPMHLSIDKTFDLSVSTNSIKDVWLSSDHVSVTWCKELIYKLAHLLSSLMDKRYTHLIKDKRTTLKILKEILLTEMEVSREENKSVIPKDWIIEKPYKTHTFNKTYITYRSEMSDNVIILDLRVAQTQKLDMLVIQVDHLGKLKPNSIYGCSKMEYPSDDKQVKCCGRIDLMNFARSLPTRRFETKKTAIKIKMKDHADIESIAIDFEGIGKSTQSVQQITLPEAIIFQGLGASNDCDMYIPTLWEYLIKRPFHKFIMNFKDDGTSPAAYHRCRLQNLRHKTQIYNLRYESRNCQSIEGTSEARILFFQSNYLIESFYPPIHQNSTFIDVKISAHSNLWTVTQPDVDKSFHLDLYIDGTCENSISIELSLLDLVVNVIQRNLDNILVCATYFSYTSIIRRSLRLFKSFEQDSRYRRLLGIFINISGFILIYTSPSLTSFEGFGDYTNKTDEFNVMLLICFLCVGTVALLRFSLDRMTDLATITYNSLSRISTRIAAKKKTIVETVSNDRSKKVRKLDLEWPVIFAILAGSVLFSKAFTSVAQLMFITCKIVILDQCGVAEQVTKNHSTNSHLKKVKEVTSDVQQQRRMLANRVKELIKQIGVLGIFALIANIPSALVKLDTGPMDPTKISLSFDHVDVFALISATSLILVKLLSDKLDGYITESSAKDYTLDKIKTQGTSYLMMILHLGCLAPIALTSIDIRYMNLTSMIVLIWVECFLFSKAHS